MTQDDRLLRDQHVSQFRFQQENVLKILSRLDVSTGTNSEQYIDTLAAFTTVFDEMNEVLNRSKRAQREHPSRSMRKSRSQRTFENQILCVVKPRVTHTNTASRFLDVGFFTKLYKSQRE
jgi:hypothetical protein